ncbi:OFA family MFS transporter [Xylophilus sp. GOD-11R]|uniref:OFA family MFS transporter n=1 Tax=Xylophilus sp. GOD-11R TaxID=3089814 RepID=UPI00298CEFFB|nr:OFA family MFS transporter [Xylophilus sp. GOD-11R]WPB55274.1 OFA family MFS transporter [Xylophilus sp. GOD-11R]
MPGFLDKERTIAGPGFNRWLVPPAALAIHLCIGMAYGFAVFWLPLSKMLATTGTGAVACDRDMSFFAELFASGCDWRIATLGWMYTLFFVFLGCSAALWGGWLERAGPRKAGVVAAVCWCGGMLLSALGIHLHQFWLMILGSGVIGGIGLGLGYISPVSTLIKWFPDRRGMATGMAIMGFGGGAMIGSPLAVDLMKHFSTPTDVGVMQTFVAMALIYFVFMMAGALGYRVPPSGWKPAGWTPPADQASRAMITQRHVHVRKVWGIPQFWLVWVVLCMNVSAGIGVIGMSSPMLQEVFGGSLIGAARKYGELDKAELAAIAVVAGGFTALLSLFNIGGRFFWATISDKLGRKLTYAIFFVLGGLLYASIPGSASAGNQLLFVGAFCIILSMYGGGFATVPAYLADLFGTQFVGAIHGRLLTAWATAGILGPVVVNYMREYQLGLGIPREQVYNQTMYILVGMLAIGLVANLLIRPVAERHFMSDEELAVEKQLAHEKAVASQVGAGSGGGGTTSPALVGIAWLAVGIPLAWGIYRTLLSAAKFFH